MTEGIIEAVVQVGAEETRYLRCGRGDRVLVAIALDAAERARLIERFSSAYRVIAPDAASCPALCGGEAKTLEAWLQGLIDGLGLTAPTLALAPSAAYLAPRLAVFAGVVVTTPPG